MPVLVESLAQADGQDLEDLLRLYADAPPGFLAPHADTRALLAHGLASGTLLAGRFNGRLLGAALLERTGDRWRLSHLCVRRLTRRRGVATRLLEDAMQAAQAAGAVLCLGAAPDCPVAQALAARWQLPLQPPTAAGQGADGYTSTP